MSKVKIAIISAISIAVIAVIAIITINLINNYYIFNINANNVSKITYYSNIYYGLEKEKLIDITDKQDINDIINIYKGTVYKTQKAIPLGVACDLTIYNKRGEVALLINSGNYMIRRNNKNYLICNNISSSKQKEYTQNFIAIIKKYVK